jgi:class 3 adenylate cyclase
MARRRSIIASASEDRLESLIQERLKLGTNKDLIDQRIWDLFGETWCVMFTDLSGFSRNVAKFGIIHFLQTIAEAERLLIPVIEEFDGILLKTEGDSFLVIFRNVNKGLSCAIKMQHTLKTHNQTKTEEERVLLCVGLGYGAVLRIGDSDVYGFEVNSASKLGEDLAEAGEILITESVKTALTHTDIKFEELSQIPTGLSKAFRVNYV